MVSSQEFRARLKQFYEFSSQERSSLLIGILITAFIFSFRDWGEQQLDITTGLLNLFLVLIIATISILFRLSCQKVYGLSQGLKAEFKVWWPGIIVALLLAIISNGRLPLILLGTMAVSFMVKQRLGEFRYGFSFIENAMIAFWGIIGNLIMAGLFALGLYLSPHTYLFSKGLALNIIMAFCSLIPLPQLDGLAIFWGSRPLYFAAILLTSIISVLLLTQTLIGLIISFATGIIAGSWYLLISSNK